MRNELCMFVDRLSRQIHCQVFVFEPRDRSMGFERRMGLSLPFAKFLRSATGRQPLWAPRAFCGFAGLVRQTAKIVRPLCPAMRLIRAGRPGGGCNWREEIAAMKAGRQAARASSQCPNCACLWHSTSSNKPLPGPTYHRPSASKMMAGRVPATPGSTTERKTFPAGNHSA